MTEEPEYPRILTSLKLVKTGLKKNLAPPIADSSHQPRHWVGHHRS